MRTSTFVWVAIVVVIAVLAAWYFMSPGSATAPTQMPDTLQQTGQDQQPAAQGPSVQAGINGSANQGNLGASSTDVNASTSVQTPQQ